MSAKAGELKQLASYTFLNNQWTKCTSQSIQKQFTPNNNNKLRIATFNTLFDNYQHDILFHKDRFLHQHVEFSNQNFDILNLNEMTTRSLELLVKDEFIQNTYNITEISPLPSDEYSTLIPYGNIILSKFPIVDLYEYTFKCGWVQERDPLRKNKSCIFATCLVPKEDAIIRVGICSVHLKSGSSKSEKTLRQLELIEIDEHLKQTLHKSDEFFLMGDFNLQDLDEENYLNYDLYEDLWLSLKSKDTPGYTLDNTTNGTARAMQPKSADWMARLDRILRMKSGKHLKASSIDLFATEPMYGRYDKALDFTTIRPKEDYLFMSDHYGVSTEMNLV
jgi:endonuclease/exonuclease/phosphatase family metal-dependent hydrolase